MESNFLKTYENIPKTIAKILKDVKFTNKDPNTLTQFSKPESDTLIEEKNSDFLNNLSQ